MAQRVIACFPGVVFVAAWLWPGLVGELNYAFVLLYFYAVMVVVYSVFALGYLTLSAPSRPRARYVLYATANGLPMLALWFRLRA